MFKAPNFSSSIIFTLCKQIAGRKEMIFLYPRNLETTQFVNYTKQKVIDDRLTENDKKTSEGHRDESILSKLQKIEKLQRPSENYVINWTPKPKDNLFAVKQPGTFIWKNLKWSWVKRVNILFCLCLGRKLCSPTFLELFFMVGFSFYYFYFLKVNFMSNL